MMYGLRDASWQTILADHQLARLQKLDFMNERFLSTCPQLTAHDLTAHDIAYASHGLNQTAFIVSF